MRIPDAEVDLSQIARILRKDFSAGKIWLFGSAARGSADRDSDIDLLVISPCPQPFFERMASVRRLLRGQGRGRPISPIVLTPEELQSRLARGDQFIAEIVNHGIEL